MTELKLIEWSQNQQIQIVRSEGEGDSQWLLKGSTNKSELFSVEISRDPQQQLANMVQQCWGRQWNYQVSWSQTVCLQTQYRPWSPPTLPPVPLWSVTGLTGENLYLLFISIVTTNLHHAELSHLQLQQNNKYIRGQGYGIHDLYSWWTTSLFLSITTSKCTALEQYFMLQNFNDPTQLLTSSKPQV